MKGNLIITNLLSDFVDEYKAQANNNQLFYDTL